MSGNSKQRKQAKDLKELLELGRHQKDSIDAHQAQLRFKDEEIETLRLRLESREKVMWQLQSEITDAWAALKIDPSEAAQDPDTERLCDSVRISLQYERDQKEQQSAEYVRRHRAVQELLTAAEKQLAGFARDGIVTRAEHKKAVEEETKKLRERLRRLRETLLAAHARFDVSWTKEKEAKMLSEAEDHDA